MSVCVGMYVVLENKFSNLRITMDALGLRETAQCGTLLATTRPLLINDEVCSRAAAGSRSSPISIRKGGFPAMMQMLV